ncbi:MAG: branched-chain amino acid ABC transporter permease [Deltaproteobacteria bacterium]|nr:branched-chain amino acid ABC transporter permease [Deltaproteobacteria bacterium]
MIKLLHHRPLAYPFLAVLCAALFSVPLFASDYWITLFTVILIYMVYASGWNLFSGLTGYINFGLAWSIGLSGYVSSILIADYGINCFLAWPVGALFTSAVSVGVGYILLRIKGVYFAISMVALTEGTRELFGTKYLRSITHGGLGIPFVAGIGLEGIYWSILIISLLTTLACYTIFPSKYGLRLMAIREDEQAAETLGIHTTREKISSFALSAFVVGLAGSIHFTYQNYIDPPFAFNIQLTLTAIVMTLFGGVGTVFGPVIGAVLFSFIHEILWAELTVLYMAVFGGILMVLVLFFPQGLLGWLKEKGVFPRTRTI